MSTALTLLAAAGAVTAVVTMVLALRRRRLVVVVDGESMAPTYRRGERVLVGPVPRRGFVVGDVVLIERPDGRSRWRTPPPRSFHAARPWMVKRIAAVGGDPVPPAGTSDKCEPGATVPAGMLVVLGDNRADSRDSRSIGFVPVVRVTGVVRRRLPHAT